MSEKLITYDNIAFLKRNTILSTLQDNTYIIDETNDNFKYIKKKFFPGNTTKEALNLVSGTGLFTSILDKYASYTGEPITDYDIEIGQAVKDYGTYGFGIIGLSIEQTKDGIVGKAFSMPGYGYFYQDGYVNLLKVYKKVGKLDSYQYYVYIQTFYENYTQNRLYESRQSNLLDFENLIPVDLDTLEETKGKEEEQEHMFGHPAIYVIKDDDNEIYPTTSKVMEMKNHIYSMDRKKVMFDTEFLKNVDSFVLFKNIDLPPMVINKRNSGMPVGVHDFGRFIEGDDKSSIEFIDNENKLISNAMESQEDDMRIVSVLSSIPLDFLGFQTAHGSLGKGSRGLLHGDFTKFISKIRSIFDKFLPDIIEDLKKVKDMGDEKYSRPDIFPRSNSELLDEAVVAKSNDLISHERAVMLYGNYNKEEAGEEIQKIEKETSLENNAQNESATSSSNG